jgi:hypothetical protein
MIRRKNSLHLEVQARFGIGSSENFGSIRPPSCRHRNPGWKVKMACSLSLDTSNQILHILHPEERRVQEIGCCRNERSSDTNYGCNRKSQFNVRDGSTYTTNDHERLRPQFLSIGLTIESCRGLPARPRGLVLLQARVPEGNAPCSSLWAQQTVTFASECDVSVKLFQRS